MDMNEFGKMFQELNNSDNMKKMMNSPELANLIKNQDFMNLANKMFNCNDDETTDKIECNDDEPRFNSNDDLKLVDLKNEEYNNQNVKYISFDNEKNRYKVELLDEKFNNKQILVKNENIMCTERENSPENCNQENDSLEEIN